MTSIEWVRNTDGSQGQTWNPFAGCSILSPGCTNCYAMKTASRIEACNTGLKPLSHAGAPHYAGTTKIVNGKPVWTGKIGIASDKVLLRPLQRKKPTTWFVNSMSDLFHENVPDEAIDKVFAVMALTPQHTYQVLTKRSARMREYCSTIQKNGRWLEMEQIALDLGYEPRGAHDHGFDWISHKQFLPNVWLGVSTERQKEADERRESLRTLATQGWITFVSYEPALGPIDWSGWEFLRWLISGGESGPEARPSHPDWHRAARDWCAASDIAYFFKQWGSWYPIIDRDNEDPDWRADYTRANRAPEKFRILNLAGGCGFHGERVHLMQRYSKSASGRLLDGVTHDAMPEAR